MQSPIKLPTVFFTELEQIISQFVWKYKTSNSHSNLEKEEWNWRNQPAWLQSYYKYTVIKTVWYWHKDRNIDQWNKIESPKINPCTYGQLMFDKGGKNIQWRKDKLFNKWCWENWSTICKRIKLEHIKRCSTSLMIRETQIKTTMRYHFMPFRMAVIQKSTSNKCWKGCGEKGTLLHCWWE